MTERSILVVEDDRDLADMMSWVLTAAGFKVTTALNGAAGLEALSRAPHCVVILDLMMPDVDGVEFRRRQQIHPIGREAPVLVVSADVQRSTTDRVRAAGASGFVAKPVSADNLLASVGSVLGGGGSAS